MLHAADFNKSMRLQKLAAYLRNCGGAATTLEIQLATGSMAVHSDIAELRANSDKSGIAISPAQYDGKSAEGHKIYRYNIKHT